MLLRPEKCDYLFFVLSVETASFEPKAISLHLTNDETNRIQSCLPQNKWYFNNIWLLTKVMITLLVKQQ